MPETAVGTPELWAWLGALALWSFLMSTAHGTGLMLLPVPIGQPGGPGGHAHDGEVLSGASLAVDATALVVHTTAMLVTMGLVAVLMYDKLGPGVLRRAWLNLDRVWATAVVAAGAGTLFT